MKLSLVGKQRHVIPYPAVEKHYGKQAAAIVARIQSSKVGKAREQPAAAFKWSVIWEMGKDPDTSDPVAFARELTNRTKAHLVATGFSGIWSEELLPPFPAQVIVRIKERARLICGSRSPPSEEPEEPEEPESARAAHPVPNRLKRMREGTDKGASLMSAFHLWCQQHPTADPILVRVVKYNLQQLTQSVEGPKEV